MSTDVIATFEASLEGTVEVTTAESFSEALLDHVAEPAVGVPLPFEGVSLPERVASLSSPSDLRAARTGVTPAGLAIADYGTTTIRSRSAGDELVSLYPERHVSVVAASDVVADTSGAFERFGESVGADRSSEVLETGPSTTADMGGLVEGVHGPRELHAVVLEDR